jgi:hypothetical protein
MKRSEALLVHAGTVLVGGTGFVYAWMRWCVTPADEFAVVNHPWQPALQHLHLLFAPVLLFAAALVWNTHAMAKLGGGQRERRVTGILLVVLLLPMVFSGYAVQVCTDADWRAFLGFLHGGLSLLWIAGYAVHQLRPRPAATPVPEQPDCSDARAARR